MKKIFLYILLMVITVTVFAQNVYVVTKTTDPNPFTDPYKFNDADCDPDMLGTLQWAINKSNDDNAESVIEFNIPGNGPHEIVLNSYLPQIKQPVTINAETQAGYIVGTPAIIINGQNKFNSGIDSYYATTKVFGLNIKNFINHGVLLSGSNNSEVRNCAITSIVNNNDYKTPAIGVRIVGCNNVSVYANNIQTKLNSPGSLSPTYGIFIDKSYYCVIGGSNQGEANIIANCGNTGVAVRGCDHNKISGNSIYLNDKAIEMIYSANGGIQPPVITEYINGILSGTALPNSTVEIFGSTGAENANEYLASVVSDSGGDWSLEVSTDYDYFAATQNEINNNTSSLFWFEFERSCNYPDAAIDENGSHLTIEYVDWNIEGNPFDFTALHLTMCENAMPFYIYDEHSAISVSGGFDPIGTPVFWYGECSVWAYSDWDDYEYNSCLYWDEASEIEPFWHDQYGFTIQFDPAEYGVGEHTINLQYGYICFISRVFITVLPTPDATITPVEPICENAYSINLTAVTPGGIWSGDGIVNSATGLFDPAVAHAGTHQIVYSIVDDCPASDTIFIEVLPIPDITATNSGPVCEGDDVILPVLQRWKLIHTNGLDHLHRQC